MLPASSNELKMGVIGLVIESGTRIMAAAVENGTVVSSVAEDSDASLLGETLLIKGSPSNQAVDWTGPLFFGDKDREKYVQIVLDSDI
jgi:hypothetical protein